MNIAVVSYSLTGNNEALAAAAAKALSAEHIIIKEEKTRKMSTIILDMIFNRTPRVRPVPLGLDKYDRILLIAPVWMGQAASPLRAYFKYFNTHPREYAFASVSGGALGANGKLAGDLKKRTGAEPAALVDLHIADLLPSDPKPTTKDTGAYRLNEGDKANLAKILLEALGSQWT